MKIAVTGSTGLVGTELTQFFKSNGDEILPIIRPNTKLKDQGGAILWNLKDGTIESDKLEDLDVVVHLAGANIASRRWSTKYKEEILNSRVQGTKFLCESLAKLKTPPKVLISTSAIGYYGFENTQESFDEDAEVGDDFLAKVCQQWEEATKPLEDVGVRVVHLRIGVVLSPKGGALAKLLPPFKLGAGGRVGSGRQIMSWVALSEIPHIISHVIETNAISGPVNVVSPKAVTNQEFTNVLGGVLKRPTIFPLPTFMVNLIFGEMGEALLLNGVRVVPSRLEESGYKFQQDDLESVFRSYLK